MRNSEIWRCATWKIGLGNLHDPVTYVVPEDMQVESHSEKNGIFSTLWTGHPEYGTDFQVETKWRKNEEGLSLGSIEFRNYEGKLFVEELVFPVFKTPFGENSKIYYPGNDLGMTEKTPPPEEKQLRNMTSASCFFIVNSNRSGIYVDHRDETHFRKEYCYWITDGGKTLIYEGIFYLPLGKSPKKEDVLPYEIALTEFKGDWFEASQIYKKWANRQSWYTVRKKPNPLRDIGLWVWNRGLVKDVCPPVLRLQKDLPGIQVALDWYWWHHNPYDTDYPDFWPPREGETVFKNAVRELKKNGVFTQTYINGALWDLDTPSWKNGGQESIIIRRDGTPVSVVFNTYNQHRLGYMCGEAPLFHDRVSSLLSKLRDCKLDSQYLDVIGCLNLNCYHPQHNHPRGGGTYITDGYRKMLLRLKKELPGFLLSTEHCNEAYMDLMDSSIVCGAVSQEHFGSDVFSAFPFFTSVYHGKNAMALYGNYALPDGVTPWDPLWPAEDRWPKEEPWHKLFPEQFFIEMMRCPIWGLQPMVCNITEHIYMDPEFSGIYNFILDTARFYHSNREFLFDGEMISPADFRCEKKEVEFFARLVFTKRECAKVVRNLQNTVLHSCWQAPDGRSALFLGNYTQKKQAWEFRGKSGSVPPRSYLKIEL